MRRFVSILAALILAACAGPGPAPRPVPAPLPLAPAAGPRVTTAVAIDNFVQAVERVTPEATRICRARIPGGNCAFTILVDDRPGQPPNAFQTLDRQGRPVLVFTTALIAEARNTDEIAFVIGHEAGHHIEGHIPRLRQNALSGAVLGAVIGAALGGEQGVRAGQDLGATVGGRAFSKEYELEADRLGALIAHNAGFDPLRGAVFFSRIPDPGDRFLGSHPPNAERMEAVRRTVARLP
ncbi:MAG: peptidase M48 [Alphaproteobacteria bacterium HGW-Alphaproteobacteria-2]|nr:MAG: peptidase M48 [Alphaproteobacteria bacterium HGW-Alphaproteobacteria-2]